MPAQKNIVAKPVEPEVEITFMTVTEFKAAFDCTKIDIVRNPNTNKLFASCNNGKTLRCKGDLDMTLPISVLVPDGVLEDACIINGSGANIIGSL